MSVGKVWAVLQRAGAMAKGDALGARLVRSGLGSGGVQMANRLVLLALSVVLARALGAEGFGVYSYAFSIMSLLLVAASAGTPTLLVREVAASHARQDWGLLRGTLRWSLRFVGLISCLVSLLSLTILWLFSGGISLPMRETTALMLLSIPVSVLGTVVATAMQGLHRVVAGQVVDLLLRPVLILLIASAGFLIWPELRQPQFAMAAQMMAAIAVLIVAAWLLCHYLPTEVKLATPKYRNREWLRSVLPFTLIGGAGIINSYTDIIMLGWLHGPRDVGCYRVAAQGASLVAFGLQAVNAVVAPQFARLYAQGDMDRLQRLVTFSARIVLCGALPVAAAFVFAGRPIIGLIFGPDYVAASVPLAILAIGQLVNAGFGSTGFLLNMTGHEGIAARILWQTAILNVVLNGVLITLFGMTGAAVASAFSLMLWNLMLYWQVRRRLGIISTAFRFGVA